MYFAELEGNRVRHIGGGDDYKVLPPNCIEIANKEDVTEGMIYKDGVFIEAPPPKEVVSVEVVKFTIPLSNNDRDYILTKLAELNGIEPK